MENMDGKGDHMEFPIFIEQMQGIYYLITRYDNIGRDIVCQQLHALAEIIM